jgi:hypothetical protein
MSDDVVEAIPPVKTWTLTPAIKLGQREYDSLTVRAPTLNEIELTDAEATVMKQIKKLTQLVSGLPPSVIELIPFYILRESYVYMQNFTSAGVAAYSAQEF